MTKCELEDRLLVLLNQAWDLVKNCEECGDVMGLTLDVEINGTRAVHGFGKDYGNQFRAVFYHDGVTMHDNVWKGLTV